MFSFQKTLSTAVLTLAAAGASAATQDIKFVAKAALPTFSDSLSSHAAGGTDD